jgi:hypothetical protein
MSIEVPYTTKPEDVIKFLKLLPSKDMPQDKIEAGYFKSLGFSLSSGNHLLKIMRQIGFLDESDKPSANWSRYLTEEKRGLVLAAGIKKAYAGLFQTTNSPYLEDDESLLDYLKHDVKSSPKDLELMLQTFRNLSELADFQDILCEEGVGGLVPAAAIPETEPEVKVNPHLQLSIQIHIDPNTPDDKIETIFKNMRRYLLGKES